MFASGMCFAVFLIEVYGEKRAGWILWHSFFTIINLALGLEWIL